MHFISIDRFFIIFNNSWQYTKTKNKTSVRNPPAILKTFLETLSGFAPESLHTYQFIRLRSLSLSLSPDMAINVMLSRNPFSFSQHIVLSISLLLPLFLSLTRLTFRPAVSEALIKPSAAAANDDLPQISNNLFMCAIRRLFKIPNTR